jgi:hypothetical protein
LLVQLVLPLPEGVDFLILVLEDLVESEKLLVEQCQLVLMVVDQVLVVSQLHYGYLVLLASLLVVLDLAVAVVKQFSAFADFVFEGGSFVLEANGHFPNLSVDHGLPLALHHVPQILQFLGLALLRGLVPGLPLLNFLGEVIAFVLLGLILLLEGEVNIAEFVLEHFVFVVEGLTDFVEFLILLPVLIDLLLLGEASLS